MGDVIGPEVLVRKRAQKQLKKVNDLIKKATTVGELPFLLHLRLEHEETIRQTYFKGDSNEHRDDANDANGGDSETQRDIGTIGHRVFDIDGDSIISANDEDGAETDKGNKTGAGDPDDTTV